MTGLRKYGVGTKTVFNKKPITCHTSDEVDEKFGDRPDLANKLKKLLSYIKQLQIPVGEIWQGDFIFDEYSKTISSDTISFRPNTIRYSVKLDSWTGRKINSCNFGIVWHTRYVGDDISNVRPIFEIPLNQIYHPDDMYMIHPYLEDIKAESKDFGNKDLFKKLDEIKFNNQYKAIIEYKTFNVLFQKYHNQLIRSKQDLDLNNFFIKFPLFVEIQKNESIAKKIAEFIKTNSYGIKLLIDIINEITFLKIQYLVQLNKYEMFEAYVDLKEGGSKHINQEGFALSSPSGKVVKIVHRPEFFYLNSSPDIKKGWEKETVKI